MLVRRLFLLGFCGVAALSEAAAQQQAPYYAYYPSSIGTDWKRLEHNILGFAADIPSAWTFGVSGSPPLAVALLYPDGANTAELTPAYASVEIGSLQLRAGSLDSAVTDLLRGMRDTHRTMRILTPVGRSRRFGREMRSLRFVWTSRNGTEIIEVIDLIADGERAVSVAIRAASQTFSADSTLLLRVARSAQPLRPRY